MRPKFLNKNDKIYLVAPSFGAATEPYNERLMVAIKNLKKSGFDIIEGANIYLAKGVVSSNTPILRAKEIHDAFLSDSTVVYSVGARGSRCRWARRGRRRGRSAPAC